MPDKVKERKVAINDAYGGIDQIKAMGFHTEKVHAMWIVFDLYPMNLVAGRRAFWKLDGPPVRLCPISITSEKLWNSVRLIPMENCKLKNKEIHHL